MSRDILDELTNKGELIRLLQGVEKGSWRRIDEEEMRAHLTSRVRGQDHVVADLTHLIRLEWGKRKRRKPIASLLFLGPPATGKTELAKAMAAYLYGDEKHLLRLNGPDFSGPEGKTRLIGTPTGYVGADSGGQLTRPMFSNKRRLILFDEVEKAWSGIFDLFLPLLGEGQLTEQGSGKTADFTESIVVMTSNAEFEAISNLEKQHGDSDELLPAIKAHLNASKLFRPEIFSRIDRIYVFHELEGIVVAEIAAMKMTELASQYGLELKYVEPELILEAMEKTAKFDRYDTRELERALVPMIGDAMLMAKEAGAKVVRLDLSDDGALEVNPAS